MIIGESSNDQIKFSSLIFEISLMHYYLNVKKLKWLFIRLIQKNYFDSNPYN